MSDEARDIANLLLREGALRLTEPLHQDLRQRLLGDEELFGDVQRRLASVGYELVQRLGHWGIRLIPGSLSDGPLRNRMGLHAGHIRLIVYLWTHLVYREVSDLRREMQTRAPGSEQASLGLDDVAEGVSDASKEPVSMSYSHVLAELGETMSESRFKGLLGALRRWRFISFDKKRDRIWADASLYTLVDMHLMEDFVIQLAQELGTPDPGTAVTLIASGSKVPDGEA